MLDHHDEFTPRRWALEHTGSAVATRLLNDALRDAVTTVRRRLRQQHRREDECAESGL